MESENEDSCRPRRPGDNEPSFQGSDASDALSTIASLVEFKARQKPAATGSDPTGSDALTTVESLQEVKAREEPMCFLTMDDSPAEAGRKDDDDDGEEDREKAGELIRRGSGTIKDRKDDDGDLWICDGSRSKSEVEELYGDVETRRATGKGEDEEETGLGQEGEGGRSRGQQGGEGATKTAETVAATDRTAEIEELYRDVETREPDQSDQIKSRSSDVKSVKSRPSDGGLLVTLSAEADEEGVGEGGEGGTMDANRERYIQSFERKVESASDGGGKGGAYVRWSDRWRNKNKKKKRKKKKRGKRGIVRITDFPVKCKAAELSVSAPEMVLEEDEDEDAPEVPESCKVLRVPDVGELYLLGTSHFSKRSRADVARTIRAVRPSAVVMELDLSRLYILSLDESALLQAVEEGSWWDQVKIVAGRKFRHGILDVFLSVVGHVLIRMSGVVPGGEFRTAVAEAKKLPDCDVHLGDRPLSITFARVSQKLSLMEKAKLIVGLIPRPMNKVAPGKKRIEVLSDESRLTKVLEKTKGKEFLTDVLYVVKEKNPLLVFFFPLESIPSVYKYLVEERDQYLTYYLRQVVEDPEREEDFNKVVGVVGAGHIPGIVNLWENILTMDLEEITKIPESTLQQRLIKGGIRLTVILAAGYLGYKLCSWTTRRVQTTTPSGL